MVILIQYTTQQKWKTDPYKAKIISNKLYGRGSTDMKGFLSVVIYNMLKNPIYPLCLTVTHDEETVAVMVLKT